METGAQISPAEQMLHQQVRAWSVLDERVLSIMRDVPRAQFVPSHYRALAFADTEIPLGHGERMLAPKFAGRLLQALQPLPADRVLEIGTGSGYLTACLAAAAAEVLSLEIHADLADRARANLRSSRVANAEVVCADAFSWQSTLRFDVIAVTGSIPEYRGNFQELLASSGRMFIVTGEAPAMSAQRIRRVGERQWQAESLFETNLRALIHAPRAPSFEF
jgi:protein-L-isoaspartate(D-aspartate) O-methyltransferase